jgi:hypothetical protein
MNQNDCRCKGDQERRGHFQNQLAGRQFSRGRLLPRATMMLKEEIAGEPAAPSALSFLTVTPASGLSSIRLTATYAATIMMIVAAVLIILLILAHSHDAG